MSASLVRASRRVASVVARSNVRMFSRETPLKDREVAAERAYFNAEDERLLKKLLGKVKVERAVSDKPAVSASKSVELQRLDAIVGKYNVTASEIEALVQWRHASDF